MEELKPCPFCGGRADLEITSLFKGDTSLVVSCTGCGCELLAKHNATEQEAIAAWNQRAERTCKVTPSKSLRGIVAGECGNSFPDYYDFCPYCGGEVVE